MGRKAIMPVNGMMQCTKCKEWKELALFSPNKTRACGVSSQCKACQANIARAAYRKNPEKAIQRTSEWIRQRPEKKQEYYEKHAEGYRQVSMRRYYEFKAQALASRTVNNAIKAGKLSRQPCEICGKPRAHGHHWSYQREHWLDVKWLCKFHHEEEHKRLRRAGIVIEIPQLTAPSE